MGHLGVVGWNKAQIRATVEEKTDRGEYRPGWPRKEREEHLSLSLIARPSESRRDGGDFEVFFTAINNPERTSFRELDTGVPPERGSRCAAIAALIYVHLYQPLPLAPSFSFFLFLPFCQIISIWKWYPGGPRSHLHDLFRATRRNNVSPLVGLAIGWSRLRERVRVLLRTLPLGLLDFRYTSGSSCENRGTLDAIYTKWSTELRAWRITWEREIYLETIQVHFTNVTLEIMDSVCLGKNCIVYSDRIKKTNAFNGI